MNRSVTKIMKQAKWHFSFLLLIKLLVCVNFCIQAQSVSHEIVYLHIDRDAYVAGENVLFKLYVIDKVTKKLSAESKFGYIVVRNDRSDPILKILVKINNGVGQGCFSLPDTLKTKIFQIVAFTSSMKNFGEKTFFRKEIFVADRFDKDWDFYVNSGIKNQNNNGTMRNTGVEIQTVKTEFQQREPVTVTLANIPDNASISISVYEQPIGLSWGKTIIDYVNEISGVPNYSNLSTSFYPESKGKIIRGYVVDTQTNKRVSGIYVLLSRPDTVANLQYSLTGADGSFKFLLSDYYYNIELFFTLHNMPANKNLKIEMEDEFKLSEPWKPDMLEVSSVHKDFISRSQDIFAINKTYQINNTTSESSNGVVNQICPSLYLLKASVIFPSDYVSLPDFAEIAWEILPNVKLRKNDNKYIARVMDSETRFFFENAPAIFLDGVFVDDIEKIIGLGSDKIRRIEVVGAERYFGDLNFQGIISIFSKNSEIASTAAKPHSLRLKNSGADKGSRFVNQVAVSGHNIPDFRQLLYWEPNVKINTGSTSTSFGFYTSDHIANYIIKVEGVAGDGSIISGSTRIQVTNPHNL